MNLNYILKEKVAKFSERTLLHSEYGEHYSYKKYDDITDIIAQGLKDLKVKKGERIAVLHPNHNEVLVAYYSILKAGAVVTPINPSYTASEVKYILGDSEARIIFTSYVHDTLINEIKDFIDKNKIIVISRNGEDTYYNSFSKSMDIKEHRYELAELNNDDVAFLIYTSGTTGKPKGVILTHGNFIFTAPVMAQTYGLRETDVCINSLPLCHVFSIASGFFSPIMCGSAIVMVERFNPKTVLGLTEKYKGTWIPGVPTMFAYMLNVLGEQKFDISSLRFGLSGGAPLPIEVHNKWLEMTNVEIVEVYGLTESTGLVTCNPFYGVKKVGSIGISAAGVSVKIVDEEGKEVSEGRTGELIFSGPNSTKGYFKMPEATKEKLKGNWVYTGDHAYRDKDGYYFIAGRSSDLIISGGYNIYPREIEEIIQDHPDVLEVAVIGIPDKYKGEMPKAYVALKPGRKAREEDIINHCKKSLSPYKIPIVQIVPELPKNQVGKIMKKQLPKE